MQARAFMPERKPFMQTQNPFVDDMAQWMTSAMGLAQGAAEETRNFARSQMNRMIAELDLVRRDEIEVLKALLAEQAARIAALEAVVEAAGGAKPAKATRAGKE